MRKIRTSSYLRLFRERRQPEVRRITSLANSKLSADLGDGRTVLEDRKCRGTGLLATLLLVDASNFVTPERGIVRAETTGAADRKGIDGGAQDFGRTAPDG